MSSKMTLYHPTDETGFIDPVDWRPASVSDLLDALRDQGAEDVTDVGYGLQVHSDEGDSFLVFRIPTV